MFTSPGKMSYLIQDLNSGVHVDYDLMGIWVAVRGCKSHVSGVSWSSSTYALAMIACTTLEEIRKATSGFSKQTACSHSFKASRNAVGSRLLLFGFG